MSEELKCTLRDAELLADVEKWVSKLCDTGGRAWTLSVPVNFNRDPDMLITELCKRYAALLARHNALREVPREQKAPSYIQAGDVAAFLASVADLDERRILAAYLYSGRRRSELLRLRWRDVALDRDEYFVGRSKAHLSRWYPMHPLFRAVLEAIGPGDPDGRIFDRWSHPDSITHLAKAALKAAGHSEMTLHKLRHTFATLLIEQGVDLVTIGALLGHTDKRATEIYAHVSDNRQREALRLVNAGPVDLGD